MLFVVRVKSVSVVVAGALFSASLCCNFSMSTKFKLSGTLFYGSYSVVNVEWVLSSLSTC